MWILLPLIFLNAVADNKEFLLVYRVDVAGMPINVLDGLIALALLASVVRLLSTSSFVVDRTHPVFIWTLVSFALATVCGVLGAINNGTEMRVLATTVRNFCMLPVCTYLGYVCLSNPRWMSRAAYILILASVASAVFALLFVRQTSEMIRGGHSFDALRQTGVGGDLGLLALAAVLFAAAEGFRMFPRFVGAGMVVISALSLLLLPHRSSWVTAALVVSFAVFLLPRKGPVRRVAVGVGSALALLLILAVGVQMYSAFTGRDFSTYVTSRLMTLLPGDDVYSTPIKAWDTRVPGLLRELELWLYNPIMGQGFGIQEIDLLSTGLPGYRHNTWTSMMAETGVFGLVASILMTVGPVVIGRRMIRDALDRGSVLIGACGAIVGCAFFLAAFMSMTFNVQRPAISLGLACGMLLKSRAIQLTLKRQHAEVRALDPTSPGGALLPSAYQF